MPSSIATRRSQGELIASALEGCWRAFPPPAISPDEIKQVASQLLATGAGALAWHRIQSHDLSVPRAFWNLRNAYRQHAIEAAIHEINTRAIFERVRTRGVEPVLFKGWALARLYPDAGLRPYGDIDLWVQPEDLDKFCGALPSSAEHIYCVDPHTSFYPQYERSFDEIMSRSQLVPLNDVQVRLPCPEDHLRFSCLHFLFHGGWRPLWLCDIALMIESAGADFDWDRCLRGKRKHADWIACTIGLAHQVLGAEVRHTPLEKRAQKLPAWLKPALLNQWERGPGMSRGANLSSSLTNESRETAALVNAVREHWRNPIQATVEMNAWFGQAPRTMLQIGAAISRLPNFASAVLPEITRRRSQLSNSIKD